MFRKSFLSIIFAAAISLIAHMAAYSQFAPVNGTVVLQKADNTTEPVAGALIEVYRTDVKGGFPSTKTNKKGEFNFAGMQFGAEYVFSISAPNCTPFLLPHIKAGQEGISITLYPGDGHKFTEAEARRGATGVSKTGDANAEMSEEERKARAEIDKQNAEIIEKNKKIEDTNKLINRLLSEGAAAFEAKNYDLAIAKFDEGYRADPDYEGSAPIMLTNKGKSLRERATNVYNLGRQGDNDVKQTSKDKAKLDYEEAITSFQKAIEVLEKAPAGDARTQESMSRGKVEALKNYVEVQGIMTKIMIDSPMLANMTPMLDKYLAAETDDAKKQSVLMTWANNMRSAGQTKTALYGYDLILAKAPENLDAIAGKGLSLFNEGVGNADKAQMQEGMNLLQKFVDNAPETHPLKQSVKDAVDYLKTAEKITPQKAPATPKKKN